MLGGGGIDQRQVIELLDCELVYVDGQFLDRHKSGRRESGTTRRSLRPHGGGSSGGDGREQNDSHKSRNGLMLLHGSLCCSIHGECIGRLLPDIFVVRANG